jgi:hypothetical protein
MSVGIFGDSYAYPAIGNEGRLIQESWINNLSLPATTCAKPGTSILWSYRQFLENHEKYERIIFLMTNPNRADHAGDLKDWSGEYNVPNLDTCMMILKDDHWGNLKVNPYISGHKWDIARVKAFKEYILHLRDDIADDMYSKLIQDSILAKRPDTIIIPFGEFHGISNWKNMPKGSTCVEYLFLQLRSLLPNDDRIKQPYKNFEEINCANHFTKEINQLFALHVQKALDVGGWQDWGINDIVSIPHGRAWDYYYETRKND